MPQITSGANATFSVPSGYVIEIQCPGGWVQLEYPVGTKVFEGNPAGRTFGPFTGTNSAKLTSVKGDIYYEVDPAAADGSPFVPSNVAITGGTIGDAVKVGVDSAVSPSALVTSLAKVRLGTADCRILLIGDSTVWGNTINPGVNSIAPQVAARLSIMTGLPVFSNFFTPASPSASPVDSRVTLGTGWSYGGTYGFGSNAAWTAAGGASGNLTITYNSFADKVRIYYLQDTGAGTFTPTINSVAKTAQSAAGTQQILKYETTFTRSNANTLVIAPSVAGFNLLGVEFFDTTQKCVYIAGAGVPSATSANWANSGQGRSIQMLFHYAPDHTIINLGINDAFVPASAATYQANISTIIAQVATTGSVDLSPNYSCDTALGLLPLETGYIAALKSLCASGGYGYLDTRAALGEYAQANASGYMSQQVHPSALGYAMASRWMARRIALAAN